MVIVEELEPCKKCGAQAEVHPYPDDITGELKYVVDCVNFHCTRSLFTAPKFSKKEEAIADWNTRQRAERA